MSEDKLNARERIRLEALAQSISTHMHLDTPQIIDQADVFEAFILGGKHGAEMRLVVGKS